MDSSTTSRKPMIYKVVKRSTGTEYLVSGVLTDEGMVGRYRILRYMVGGVPSTPLSDDIFNPGFFDPKENDFTLTDRTSLKDS